MVLFCLGCGGVRAQTNGTPLVRRGALLSSNVLAQSPWQPLTRLFHKARYLHADQGLLIDVDLRSNMVVRVDAPSSVNAIEPNAYIQPTLLQSNAWHHLRRGLYRDRYLHLESGKVVEIDRRSHRLTYVDRPAGIRVLEPNAYMPAASFEAESWRELIRVFDRTTYLNTTSGALVNYHRKAQRILAINKPAAVREAVLNAYFPTENLAQEQWELLSRTFYRLRYRNKTSRMEIFVDEQSKRIVSIRPPSG